MYVGALCMGVLYVGALYIGVLFVGTLNTRVIHIHHVLHLQVHACI